MATLVTRAASTHANRTHRPKLHFLTREQLLARCPEAQTFIDVRRGPDPEGTFLNERLRPLLQ